MEVLIRQNNNIFHTSEFIGKSLGIVSAFADKMFFYCTAYGTSRFVSVSAVSVFAFCGIMKNFFEIVEDKEKIAKLLSDNLLTVCIGPITAKVLEKYD